MRPLLPKLELSADARRTFRFHLAYALLDAACGGILLNAPVVALRIGGENWQLPMRDAYAGIGMLATLYLGSRMASRRKMPYVFIPGMLAGFSALLMAVAMAVSNPFWLLTFFGIGAMFEAPTRPAIAAILRQCYPVAQRGHATGTVRQWSSLCFMAVLMMSAFVLDRAGSNVQAVAAAQFVVAAVLGLMAFVCFRQIRTPHEPEDPSAGFRLDVLENLRDAGVVLVRDARFRRYLFGCVLDGFFFMLYSSLVAALLSTTLHFDYRWCAALKDGIPTLAAFMATGLLGRLFDRANPWRSWAWVRFACGIDGLLLAATPLAASFLHPSLFVLPVLGRILRGSVQGGRWILWWQIGVTHFAPPGADTSRYMGIVVFLNGAVQMLAAMVAMLLTSNAIAVRPVTLIWIGAIGVILSGFYSLAQAARERREHRPQTFAEFEAAFANRE
jgi:hypothetical protein